MTMDTIKGFDPVAADPCPKGGAHEWHLHSLKPAFFLRRVYEVLKCHKCGARSKGWYPDA